MVESVDESVGRLMQKLDDLESRTARWSSSSRTTAACGTKESDQTRHIQRAAARRQGHLYEGGIREPLIVRWPGVVKAGSVCDEPVISIDFYPTILEMAGVG